MLWKKISIYLMLSGAEFIDQKYSNIAKLLFIKKTVILQN